MKYKVGDIVKIRDDLIPGETYDGLTMWSIMSEDLIGNTFNVAFVYDEVYEGAYDVTYRIGGYYVKEVMIERRVSTMNILHIENRIAKLKTNPVENANIIRKWERKLRKANQEVA